MKIEIKSRWNTKTLFVIKAGSVKLALEIAVKSKTDLSEADLSGADLSEANLSEANFYGADLSGADLSGADLSEANLSEANFYGADFYGAILYGANLSGANLSGANFYGANLSEANLSGADFYGAILYGANLSEANLSGANLSGANFYGANLSGANLSGANFYGANLSETKLSGANLSGANLSGANFYGAFGTNKYLCTPLLMLLDQPGKIRAYKLVNANLEGPYNGGIKYTKNTALGVENANCDENKQCAAGINVATLNWCMREWREGYRILIAEFEAADIASIPTATDGKFRVHRCVIVGEKDLVEIGLLEANHEIS